MNLWQFPWWAWLLSAGMSWGFGTFWNQWYEDEVFMESPSKNTAIILQMLCYAFRALAVFCGIMGIVRAFTSFGAG